MHLIFKQKFSVKLINYLKNLTGFSLDFCPKPKIKTEPFTQFSKQIVFFLSAYPQN